MVTGWFGFLQTNQFILPGAEAEFFCMLKRRLPVGIRMRRMEMVVGIVDMMAFMFIKQQALRIGGCCIDGINTSLVECNRVKRSKHTDIRDQRHIVFGMAVAVRGYIDDQRDVEAGTAIDDRLGVFGNFAVEHNVGFIIPTADRIGGTNTNAPAAANAFIMVNVCLFLGDRDRAMGANTLAHAAADTGRRVDLRLAGIVHFHFTGARAAAHANVFQASAEAGCLVAFKVRQRNKDVCIHDCLTDFGFLDIFAAFYRDIGFICALQTIGNDDMTTRGERRKAVDIRRIQMIERIFAAADIERVAVGQKRFAAAFLDKVYDRFGPVGTQIRQIAWLPKVDLDGCKFLIEVDFPHAGGLHQTGELLRKIFGQCGAEIAKMYQVKPNYIAACICRAVKYLKKDKAFFADLGK